MRRILLLAALVTLPAGCATTEHHIGMPLDAGAGRLLTNEAYGHTVTIEVRGEAPGTARDLRVDADSTSFSTRSWRTRGGFQRVANTDIERVSIRGRDHRVSGAVQGGLLFAVLGALPRGRDSWLMGAGAITGSLIGAVIGGGIADRDAYVFAPTTATGSSPTEAALDR